MSQLEDWYGVGKARVSKDVRRRYLRRRTSYLGTLEKMLYDPASPLSELVRPLRFESGENAFLHPVGRNSTGYLVVSTFEGVRYFFGTGECFRNGEVSTIAEAVTFPLERTRLVWYDPEFRRFYLAVSTTIGDVIQDALVSRHMSPH